jgi:hypothetical protein
MTGTIRCSKVAVDALRRGRSRKRRGRARNRNFVVQVTNHDGLLNGLHAFSYDEGMHTISVRPDNQSMAEGLGATYIQLEGKDSGYWFYIKEDPSLDGAFDGQGRQLSQAPSYGCPRRNAIWGDGVYCIVEMRPANAGAIQ